MYQRINKLVSIEEAKKLSLNVEKARLKSDYDRHIQESLSGNGKFLLLIGPCSADDESALMKYCEELKRLEEEVRDKLFVVPRIYTAKPRSLVGSYRGMLHSPEFGHDDINGGIIAARRLMVKVAENFGFFAADELLYPELYGYFDDLLSYVTIGARSSDDQLHRMMASALDVAVGIKNPLGGSLLDLARAIKTAMSPNDFAFMGYELRSSGNAFAHAILRGYTDSHDKMHPNFGRESIERFLTHCKALEIDPPIIIDCNHGNSGKNFLLEPKVALSAVKMSREISNIRGLMIESYLYDGRQDIPLKKGVSLTDGCLGIDKTKQLVYKIAELL